MNTNQDRMKPYFITNLIFFVLICILNLVGSSLLKWVLLAYVGFALVSISLNSIENILFIFITFLFLEGQGRVVWEYNALFRIIFDLCVSLSIIRQVTVKKSLFPKSNFPLIITLCAILHMLWYVFEIFNIYNVGVIGPIAATKIYILPILLFFTFNNIEFDLKSEHFKRLCLMILILFIGESIVSFVQLIRKEELMLSIANYYRVSMRGDVFIGAHFRPYGTTHLPGAISIYFCMVVGFFFLAPQDSRKYKIFSFIALVLALFIIFTTMVRSALLKYILLLAFGFFAKFLSSENKFKYATKNLTLLTLFVLITMPFINLNKINQVVDLSKSIDRVKTLTQKDQLKTNRIGFSQFIEVAHDKLSKTPFGLGPGLTGAAGSISAEEIKKDLVLNMGHTWTYDNLIISIIIDFGWGGIFFLALILIMPLIIFSQLLHALRLKNKVAIKVKILALSIIVTILVGNWGAIGLTYNPESFMFWLWCALGLQNHYGAAVESRY